jgi:hypothetical protein
MNKIYIIGDCHTTRLNQYHIKAGNDLDISFWGKAGLTMHAFDPISFANDNLQSTQIEQDEITNLPDPKKWEDIKDDGIVVLWLGYVDAKNYLFKYNNAESTARQYLERIGSYFPNSKIILMDPHPQFVDNMHIESEQISVVNYAERKIQNDYLCEALRNNAEEFGIKNIITQDEIFLALGLPQITKNETASYFEYPQDGLDQRYIKNIYDLIISKITVD